jgi:hypothetical protein
MEFGPAGSVRLFCAYLAVLGVLRGENSVFLVKSPNPEELEIFSDLPLKAIINNSYSYS